MLAYRIVLSSFSISRRLRLFEGSSVLYTLYSISIDGKMLHVESWSEVDPFQEAEIGSAHLIQGSLFNPLSTTRDPRLEILDSYFQPSHHNQRSET